MRTTINIDEHVLATAKDEARAQGITLGEYIENRLAGSHDTPYDPADDPQLPVYEGDFERAVGEMSNRELHELLDEGVPLDKLR